MYNKSRNVKLYSEKTKKYFISSVFIKIVNKELKAIFIFLIQFLLTIFWRNIKQIQIRIFSQYFF